MYGLGGLNPKQMEKMLRQLGIKTEEINANSVRIGTDQGTLVLNNPKVTVMDMKGQKIFQIIADSITEEKNAAESTEEDIQLIVEQTGCTKEEAISALKESNGDIAEAILKVKR